MASSSVWVMIGSYDKIIGGYVGQVAMCGGLNGYLQV